MKESIQPNPNGDRPQVDPTAYVHPTARIIGNVHIGPEVFVGPYAVIRADEADADGNVHPIHIEAQCNVQDAVIIHALAGTEVIIGPRTSLAHGCIIHGPCTIAAECFIGFRAVVYNAELAQGVLIHAAAIIQGVNIAACTLVPPAAAITSDKDVTQLTTTSPADREFMQKIVNANLHLTQGYRTSL